MSNIEFTEEELHDLNRLAEKLFTNIDEKNPASIYYKRHLDRPKINLFKMLIHPILILILLTTTYFLVLPLNLGLISTCATETFVFILYIIINLKHLLIGIVKIYQCLAPDSIRNKCRFEPSCSQYMILSLKKYGAWKGFSFGIKRIKRCKVGNGGYDFP